MKGNTRESAQASRTVSSSGKLSFTPPPVLAIRQNGLATPEEMRDSGVLDASFEEKELLANFDTAYVEFKNGMTAKAGDMLILFRPAEQIVSPTTHRVLGQRVKTVGEAKVLSWNGKLATVQITRALEEIQRGDRARPWTPQMVRVSPRPNGRELSGVIVSSVTSGVSELGESNQVYVDKGKADGVEVGNTFVVVRKGDGLSAGPLDSGHVSSAYMAGEAGMRASTVKALVVADSVIILIESSSFALLGMNQLLKTIAAISETHNPALKILALTTLFDRRQNLDRIIRQQVEHLFGRSLVLESVIHRHVGVAEAAAMRKGVVENSITSSATFDFMKLFNELKREMINEQKRQRAVESIHQ